MVEGTVWESPEKWGSKASSVFYSGLPKQTLSRQMTQCLSMFTGGRGHRSHLPAYPALTSLPAVTTDHS